MSLFGGMLAFGANNMMEQFNANADFKRQQMLMAYQNRMNNQNNLNAQIQQVEGMRMAGLNPALAQTTSAPSANVGLGSASKAATIPINPADSLVMAQAENIREDTRGKQQQNDIVEAGNDAMLSSYADSVKREMDDLEKGIEGKDSDNPEVQKIQERIDKLDGIYRRIKSGEIKGALGIAKGIASASEASKNNMDIVSNYLRGRVDRAVLEKQIKDPATINALAKMPKVQQRKLAQEIEAIKQSITESKHGVLLKDAKIAEIGQHIQQMADTILQAQVSDGAFIKYKIGELQARAKAGDKDAQALLPIWQKQWDNWTELDRRKVIEDVLTHVVPAVVGGTIAGKMKAPNISVPESSKDESKPTIFQPTASEMDKVNGFPRGSWYK